MLEPILNSVKNRERSTWRYSEANQPRLYTECPPAIGLHIYYLQFGGVEVTRVNSGASTARQRRK